MCCVVLVEGVVVLVVVVVEVVVVLVVPVVAPQIGLTESGCAL